MAPRQDREVIVIDDDDENENDNDVYAPNADFFEEGNDLAVQPLYAYDPVNDLPNGMDAFGNGMDQPFADDDAQPLICEVHVRAVFPDICQDYLGKLTDEHGYNPDVIIDTILNSQEKGEKYPRQQIENPRKRKRTQSSDDDGGDDMDELKTENDIAKDIRAKIAEPEYDISTANPTYKKLALKLLPVDFPKVHMSLIRTYLAENHGSVFKTYTAMLDLVYNQKNGELPWPEKKARTQYDRDFERDRINNLNMDEYTPSQQLAIAELRAARELADFKQGKAESELEEKNNFDHAKSAGQTEDCGCCFEECAINRMIHCDGEKPHRFCRDCMRSQVETNIGLSKHQLTCMSMDGCSAGFEDSQKKLFLDKKTLMALDRLEMEASLRMAGIENLETCPFCPYAAEYPPPEENKEFRCENPDCEKISCRLCRKESHIPRTCEENAIDHGLSARHVLEEAMSEALIRKCNKCKHPYVKLEGCNKVMCTRCRTLQCYVCRQTIVSYNHFNDTSRGGQEGRCPLYDQTEQRHEEEIRRAEEATRKKVEKENPGLSADALNIKVSDEVKKDEERRLQKHHGQQRGPRAPANNWGPLPLPPGAGIIPPVAFPMGPRDNLAGFMGRAQAGMLIPERRAQPIPNIGGVDATAAARLAKLERDLNAEVRRLQNPLVPNVANAGRGAMGHVLGNPPLLARVGPPNINRPNRPVNDPAALQGLFPRIRDRLPNVAEYQALRAGMARRH